MDAVTIRTVMALLLTISLELLAYCFFIKRKIPKKERWVWVVFIIGLNLFTNPMAHFFYYFLSSYILSGFSWIITEFLVLLIEALLIHLVMRVTIKNSIIYSLILNGTSIVLGEYVWWGVYLLY
ncbi:hypothetical protein [Legionella fallonii]|uniref:Uncharacterized protein n=1 Tax=Legionella fallonii LLAP-10 TaxID=1212491 RepID=A0A098G3M1_9GAMM|nr:hypothetical protein [Legionella fallonii]CEG57068.1 membrane protein of unknown function [Legionella fallonii LLAP-10]